LFWQQESFPPRLCDNLVFAVSDIAPAHRQFTFDAIGVIRSPFKEKFGIPRQSGLMDTAEAVLELLPPYDREEAVRGLDGFSHLWITFVFHGVRQGDWSPTVRPPRLGGNQRLGVFATRSTHRPNPIGLSLVEIAGIRREQGRLLLDVRGADLMDGTPVLDIKPYLPYADARPDARAGFAAAAPDAQMPVVFGPEAEAVCTARAADLPQLRRFIEQMLRLDPRPAYQAASEGRVYGTAIFDLDVRWTVADGAVQVLTISPAA
jgi:tRNA-Thr(GGU) m(6)t(6)A37 methyltransferase TsaA